MTTIRTKPLAKVFDNIVKAVANEAEISYRFISNDIWTTIIPATAFVITAARYSGLSGYDLGIAFIEGALYFWLYIYGFNLTNQLYGIEEDRINKPFRPLVTGRSSYRGAQLRCAVVLVAFPLVAWWFGVLLWAVVWEVTYLLSNVARWERHWFFKDLFMGIGVLSQLAAAWQIVARVPPLAWQWILTLAITILVLIPLQDIRDVDGDLANGRRTFPIALGMRFTRAYLAVGFAALPVAVHLLLMTPSRSPLALVADVVLALLSWWIALRVALFRSPHQDHITYRRFEQWYSITLLCAILVL